VRSTTATAVLVAAALVVAAAVASGAAAPAAKPQKKKPSAALRAPQLQSPRDDITVDAVPPFTWGAVARAAGYEFQMSADGAFRSSVFGRGRTSMATRNTAATITTALADGNYFWRVRAVNAKGDAGPWSKPRALHKSWTQTPTLQAPQADATINYPQPLVLSWSRVPRAFKYSLEVATDRSLGSPAPYFDKGIETSGTDFAVGLALAPGRYFWAVTPLDADTHKGQRSPIGTFTVAWPSATATRVSDLNPDDRIYDPQFSWDAVPGAARYEVEINGSDDFAPGSKVCCSDPTTGTSLSPAKVLPNNTGAGGGYFWRVRAIDVDGNAGQWNMGPGFPKYFNPTADASIPNLHVRDHTTDLVPGGTPNVAYPVIAWDPAPGAASYEVQVAPTLPIVTTFGGASGTTITVGSTASMVPGTPVSFGSTVRTLVSVVDSTHVVIDQPLTTAPALGSLVKTRANFCNWTPTGADGSEFWDVRTAATAWTPLSGSWNGISPVGGVSRTVSYDPGNGLVEGQRYCVRVRARGDRDWKGQEVVSPWTELGNFLGAQPTFKYEPPAPAPCGPFATTQPPDYLSPMSGEVTGRLPLFTWKPVSGACSYYVIVARDESFTDIVDIGLTREPVYAPRNRTNPKTYTDEQSSYYWAVLPSPQGDGGGLWSLPENNWPQQFQKRSTPPGPVAPIGGVAVSTQPTFRWTGAEGARDYRLQVSQDPSFGDPIEDVTTNALAFTSSSTYPADTTLYWRVRADDESRVGLAWSSVQTFRRELPSPRPAPDNPLSGRTIPLLRWSSVPGAVSYDLHIDQPDGTGKDFNLRSAAFTPTRHFGTGVWRWKVRANFPKLPYGDTPGPYSDSTPFTRFIGAPAAARGVANSRRVLLSWDPVEMARAYRVEVSNNSSFLRVAEAATTDNTSFAPRLLNRAFADGGVLHWRVASVDEGNNLGGFTSGTFSLPKRIKIRLNGNLRRGQEARITVSVTDTRGRGVRRAKVRVGGSGMRVLSKRTTKRGTTAFRLRPRRAGTVTFLATKGGYRSGSASLKVR
jgi:hypothetical protein